MERVDRDKDSRALRKLVNYRQKSFITLASEVTEFSKSNFNFNFLLQLLIAMVFFGLSLIIDGTGNKVIM
jgi:hypothetical protein